MRKIAGIWELSKKKIDVPDVDLDLLLSTPLLVCVLLSYLFNNLLRFGFCLSTVSCLFTFHTWLFLKHKKYCKTLLLLLLFANAYYWYLAMKLLLIILLWMQWLALLVFLYGFLPLKSPNPGLAKREDIVPKEFAK